MIAMTAGLGAVLAHQGGWDEILLIAGPIVVIAALLALAKRRVDRLVPVGGVDDTADDAGVDTTVGVDTDD